MVVRKKRARAKKIAAALKKAYPDARCSLHFSNPLELLVATILSAQCTDQQVNQVTKALFRKYRTAADYANVAQEELAEDIRPAGFFRNKAKSIIACCRALVERHGGQVPATMEELTQLAGVGRKTANVILGNAFGQQGIAVDTHVRRLAGRLGLTQHDDPDKIEQDLMRLLPKGQWTFLSHALIWHGRQVCHARRPKCPVCLLNAWCPSAEIP